MDIHHLDLKNERLVLEALAIHCTCPIEWGAEPDLQTNCVAENLAKLEARFPKTILYVQDHGRIIALHWLEVPIRRHGYIRSLWIDPAYRRGGLATALKLTGEQWFADQGVQTIETEVSEQNPPRRALNDRLGYVAKGDKFIKQLTSA